MSVRFARSRLQSSLRLHTRRSLFRVLGSSANRCSILGPSHPALTMQLFLSLLVLVCFVSLATAYVKTTAFASRAIASHLAAIEYDSQGYVIKPRDWFNGLSGDPGASLTDPRAVPAEAKSFAEAIKAGTKQVTLAETLALIDAHYNYFEVPFVCGEVKNEPNVNVGSAKILSFGLMTGMSEEQTLRLFGEVARDLTADGTDHANVRNFKKLGWSKVVFSSGMAIISKLQAFDDTESAMATQSIIEGGDAWDLDSDNWMP